MRSWTLALLLLLAVLAVPGCGRSKTKAAMAPLSVEMWSSYEPQKKYEIATIERLKNEDPKFTDDAEWDRFMKTVVIPGRKRELPNGLASK
jgi:hypothetical protein